MHLGLTPQKGDTYIMGIGWMKIMVFLAILPALGSWRMVFSFPKKPVLLSAFFSGQKTGTKWST
jgi:hypothetical protein